MENCLGIYIGKNTVKYAKLAKIDNLGTVKVLSYGVKQSSADMINTINNIIAETGSVGIPIALNLQEQQYHSIEILKQINKKDLDSLVDLEVFDYIGRDDPNATGRTTKYRYYLGESIKSKDNYEASVVISDQKDIQQYTENQSFSIKALYPTAYIIDELVGNKEQNYLIVSMNERTELSFVNARKLRTVVPMDVGMDKIMTEVPRLLGSYEKAYEACKAINVFSEENTNNLEVEAVIEPVLQDALNRIQAKIKELNIPIDKIYLSGMINLFINIDVLFEQYFEIKTEKLRPFFIDKEDTSINISEAMEADEAFALAYEYFLGNKPELDFMNVPVKNDVMSKVTDFVNNKLLPLITKKKNQTTSAPKREKRKIDLGQKDIAIGKLKLATLIPILTFTNVVIFILIAVYSIFSGMYAKQLSDNAIALREEQQLVETDIAAVQKDMETVSSNQLKYAEYNQYVSDAITKITNGEIGKYSTYNVALFMLKVSKYIPKGVTLLSITSDTNKRIEIKASSGSYPQLGYLVSQIKLQNILTNVTIQTTITSSNTGEDTTNEGGTNTTNETTTETPATPSDTTETPSTGEGAEAQSSGIETGATITITIGGDLP